MMQLTGEFMNTKSKIICGVLIVFIIAMCLGIWDYSRIPADVARIQGVLNEARQEKLTARFYPGRVEAVTTLDIKTLIAADTFRPDVVRLKFESWFFSDEKVVRNDVIE